MALYYIVKNTTPGGEPIKLVPFPGYVEEMFAAGSVNLNLTYVIDADHVINVWINGGLQDQDAFSVDLDNNRIVLDEAPSQGTVRIRIYLH